MERQLEAHDEARRGKGKAQDRPEARKRDWSEEEVLKKGPSASCVQHHHMEVAGGDAREQPKQPGLGGRGQKMGPSSVTLVSKTHRQIIKHVATKFGSHFQTTTFGVLQGDTAGKPWRAKQNWKRNPKQQPHASEIMERRYARMMGSMRLSIVPSTTSTQGFERSL